VLLQSSVITIMRISRAICLLGLPVLAGLCPAKEELLPLYGQDRVAIEVPEDWNYASRQDDGLVSAQLSDQGRQVSLQITFFPDPEGRMADVENQTALMGDLAMEYIEGSVEKAAKLEPLKPRRGSGLFCVFTDAKLAGKTELPPNEYRHATAGIRSSAGWFAAFTLLSQDTTSPAYRRALGLLRTSLQPTTSGAKRVRDPLAF